MSPPQWTRYTPSASYCGKQQPHSTSHTTLNSIGPVSRLNVRKSICATFFPSLPLRPLTHKQPGHISAACSRFKCANTRLVVPHTQQSAHVLNINWKVGLRVRGGKMLTCEHAEAPHVSEDTRVCFTEQIPDHCLSSDPGLLWGHLDYHTDGWTHSQNSTAGDLSTGKYKVDIRILTCQKVGDSTHFQEMSKCMDGCEFRMSLS